MDERFPKPLRWLAKKLEFIAVPNLGPLICALAGMALVAKLFWGTPLERFMFDPEAVRQGEWWRLFAFPLPTGTDGTFGMIWAIFYLLYIYYVFSALEQAWGAASLTLFVLVGYIAALGGAFLVDQPLSIWFYVIENVSLAFGTLFPEMEFYIYFILPVKAKWLAMLAGALVLLQFIVGSVMTKLFLLIVMSPYLIFFSPMLIRAIKTRRAISRNRRRFDGEN